MGACHDKSTKTKAARSKVPNPFQEVHSNDWYFWWKPVIRLKLWAPLVRESVAHPYMDFQNSTVIHTDSHGFWMSVFRSLYKYWYPNWYPTRDIHARSFYYGVSDNVRELKIIWYNYDIMVMIYHESMVEMKALCNIFKTVGASDDFK